MPIYNISKNHKSLTVDKHAGSQSYKNITSLFTICLGNQILKRTFYRDVQGLSKAKMIMKTSQYYHLIFSKTPSPFLPFILQLLLMLCLISLLFLSTPVFIEFVTILTTV